MPQFFLIAIAPLIFWFAIRRPWELWNIEKAVSKEDLEQAKKDARSSSKPILKKLPYAEDNYRWVLLYNHVRKGQISPVILKRMRRSDLEFLAGMDYPHPDLSEPKREKEFREEAEKRHEQLTKLQGNVSRAKAELSKRNLWNTTVITVYAVLAAGALGAYLVKK